MKGIIIIKIFGLNYVINIMIELKDLVFVLLFVLVKFYINEIW